MGLQPWAGASTAFGLCLPQRALGDRDGGGHPADRSAPPRVGMVRRDHHLQEGQQPPAKNAKCPCPAWPLMESRSQRRLQRGLETTSFSCQKSSQGMNPGLPDPATGQPRLRRLPTHCDETRLTCRCHTPQPSHIPTLTWWPERPRSLDSSPSAPVRCLTTAPGEGLPGSCRSPHSPSSLLPGPSPSLPSHGSSAWCLPCSMVSCRTDPAFSDLCIRLWTEGPSPRAVCLVLSRGLSM